jgi:hypothetical protein
MYLDWKWTCIQIPALTKNNICKQQTIETKAALAVATNKLALLNYELMANVQIVSS